jgi:hypothetical protein
VEKLFLPPFHFCQRLYIGAATGKNRKGREPQKTGQEIVSELMHENLGAKIRKS